MNSLTENNQHIDIQSKRTHPNAKIHITRARAPGPEPSPWSSTGAITADNRSVRFDNRPRSWQASAHIGWDRVLILAIRASGPWRAIPSRL